MPAGYTGHYEFGGGGDRHEWILWNNSAVPDWVECEVVNVKDPSSVTPYDDGSTYRNLGTDLLAASTLILIVDILGTHYEKTHHKEMPVKLSMLYDNNVIGIKATGRF